MTAPALTAEQERLLAAWLPGYRVLADHSWGQTSTVVLEVRAGDCHAIVKACGPENHHLGREIEAHTFWLGPWRAAGLAAPLLHHDEAARILVTDFVEGTIIEGTTAQDDPEIFRQAGAAARQLHEQDAGRVDPEWSTALRERVERWLARPHRIDPEILHRLRAELDAWPSFSATLVPTHGDYQPRNWIISADARLRIIDFGRAALRPCTEDFTRLHEQDFARLPELEAAFLEGYGSDPRAEHPEQWRCALVAEAVGVAAWGYSVGDVEFEAQGHERLARLYSDAA